MNAVSCCSMNLFGHLLQPLLKIFGGQVLRGMKRYVQFYQICLKLPCYGKDELYETPAPSLQQEETSLTHEEVETLQNEICVTV